MRKTQLRPSKGRDYLSCPCKRGAPSGGLGGPATWYNFLYVFIRRRAENVRMLVAFGCWNDEKDLDQGYYYLWSLKH